jgi:hypothetical protein
MFTTSPLFNNFAKKLQPMTDPETMMISPWSQWTNQIVSSENAHILTLVAEANYNATWRTSEKYAYYNFSVGYLSCVLRVEITRASRKMVQLIVNDNNPMHHLTASDLWDGAI